MIILVKLLIPIKTRMTSRYYYFSIFRFNVVIEDKLCGMKRNILFVLNKINKI